MHRSKEALESLEQAASQTHRLYLASLMRVEALEDAGVLPGTSERETAEIDRALNFRLMNALIDRLGYIPKRLAKRSEIRREIAAEVRLLMEQPRSQPSPSARTTARAEVSVRSA